MMVSGLWWSWMQIFYNEPPELELLSDYILENQLRKWVWMPDLLSLRKKFDTSVAMRLKKYKDKQVYDVSRYAEDDFYKYWTSFISFLTENNHFWTTMNHSAAFKVQRDWFIAGIQPPSLSTMFGINAKSSISLSALMVLFDDTVRLSPASFYTSVCPPLVN
jgi:hypothetical protein